MYLERSTAIQQKQSLTVSNNLIQSLKILQFRNDELSAFLEDQAERNPFLQVTHPLASPTPTDHGTSHATREDATARTANLEQTDRGRPNLPGRDGPAPRTVDPDQLIAATCCAQTSLREHLHRQIVIAFDDPVERGIARDLADNIDPDGYLRTDLDLLADTLGTDEDQVERVLRVVQGLDPAGIGARDLAECLRLQLIDRGLMTPPMEQMLQNLPLLARFDIARLAAVTRTCPETVIGMARTIKSLDPKPGLRFDPEPIMPALPDVLIGSDADGQVGVELNTDMLPRVLVDREYSSRIRTGAASEEDRRFVSDCLGSAGFLTRCLDQRAQTLLKVATEIAARQSAFLRHGRQHLRPLSLRDVAEATGLHESTVCRAVANKYAMTPFGMFELKFFFSNAVGGTSADEDHSAETVRLRIRKLIDSEGVDTVLCDGQIVDALKEAGIHVARRTVAKYRDMLRITSSLQRRRAKRALLEHGCA